MCCCARDKSYFARCHAQEALGVAVAQEMEKVYKKELEPEPVPRIVAGFPVDEEDVSFEPIVEVTSHLARYCICFQLFGYTR
jgi:hypothetical protein